MWNPVKACFDYYFLLFGIPAGPTIRIDSFNRCHLATLEMPMGYKAIVVDGDDSFNFSLEEDASS